jgi:hypothetical protein
MSKVPEQIMEKLLLPSIKAMSTPFSTDAVQMCYEVHKRIEKIIEAAYLAGYAQRDAEVMITNINQE